MHFFHCVYQKVNSSNLYHLKLHGFIHVSSKDHSLALQCSCSASEYVSGHQRKRIRNVEKITCNFGT